MKKKRTVVIALLVFAILVFAAIGLYVVRNINEKPPIVVEQRVDNTPPVVENTPIAPVTISSSMLKGVDDIHWAKGSVTVLKSQDGAVLSFNDDFEVAKGPDLFVYLSPNEAGKELGEFASLGNLKAHGGAQQYTLPNNYEDYKTVVIWCRAFGVIFATAEI